MEILVEFSMLQRELSNLLVELDSFHQFFEVLAIIEGTIDEAQALQNVCPLAKIDESNNRLFQKTAFFESQIYDSLVLSRFYRQK